MVKQNLLNVLLILSFLFGLIVSQNTTTTCPSKCYCHQRTVRCLRQQLQVIPNDIPLNTGILDLRYNHIREIPTDIFLHLPYLHTIFLNENQITKIYPGSFRGLSSLKYLYLNRNRINKLDANMFENLGRLQSLYLQFNEIAQINEMTFSHLSKLERLFLYNNRITNLPKDIFKNMVSLKRLRLDGNPLHCDCSLLWFIKMIRANKNRIEATASCKTPSDMQGRNLITLREDDFYCTKPHIMKEPNDIKVKMGETAVLKCNAVGDPKPEIIWMQNSNKINMEDPRLSILPDGSLRIDRTNSKDMGQYECMARNVNGEVMSRPARMIMHNEAHEVDDEAQRPRFTLTPLDAAVTSHDPIVLHCAAIGYPDPRITWFFKNRPVLQSTERIRIFPNGTLVITDPNTDDSGTYKCEAGNFLGSISSNANVRVNTSKGFDSPRVAPKITVPPENQTVKSGESILFECEANGALPPQIWWKKNGRPLAQTSRIFFVNDNKELHIEHAKESDSGLYVCVAENSYGTSESVANLTVQSLWGPPQLLIEPYDIDALPRTTIELPCRGDGDPIPQTRWQKDGRTVVKTARHRISASGSLFISNVTDLDAGRYECSIVNEYGRVTASGLITVRHDETLAPGDRFVRIAFAEATKEVDKAINQTVSALFSKNLSDQPRHHGELFRLFRFPNAPTRELARAAEIYERTLVNIRKHVDSGEAITTNITDFNYKDLLSSEHLELVAQLSGCMSHRITPNCTNMCYHMKYRSIDGICNNLKNPVWGSSLTGFRRILPPIYENGFSMPIGWTQGKLYHGFTKPSARLISTSLISTEEISQDAVISHMVMQWGQFFDHDLDHAIPSVTSESWDGVDCKKTCDYAAPCFPMEVPADDPRIKNRRCIDFIRSSAICGSGMTSVFFNTIEPREQINQLTAYIDASQVYGYTLDFAQDLRNLTSDSGLLREGVHFPNQKSMLPFASPTDGVDCRRDIAESTVNCFVAGDIRVNEQTGLLAMHTIWFREHNRIALKLKEVNPHWPSDTLYNEARKIVGSQMQHITYKHWLPRILGAEGMKILGEYKGYNPDINPSISNEFATAALRFGHSLINPILHRLNETFEPIPQGHLPLHKAFFAPWRLVYEGGVDPIMRGLFTVPAKLKQPQQNLNSDLTEKLFQTAHAVALDLAAMNIQRSRDHAIPGYNEYRRFCNMTVAENFDDLSNEISSEDVRTKLKNIYGHPGNIDIWVGGILEDQLEGGKVGPLFRCILIDQFKRLRDGDRFWYENPAVYKPEQLAQIQRTSLARVLCENGDNITRVTEDVFMIPEQQGGYKDCSQIAEMDLRLWSDCRECSCRESISLTSSTRARRSVRRKRDINMKSVTVDRITEVHDNATLDNEIDFENDMNEERVEGLEIIIKKFEKSLKQMRKKIHKLEQTCKNNKIKTHGHCVDELDNRRVNNEIWSKDECTTCQCQHHQINCTTEKCPPITTCKLNEQIKTPGQCCHTCVNINITSSTTQMPTPILASTTAPAS